jgi:hypothetical protein
LFKAKRLSFASKAHGELFPGQLIKLVVEYGRKLNFGSASVLTSAAAQTEQSAAISSDHASFISG